MDLARRALLRMGGAAVLTGLSASLAKSAFAGVAAPALAGFGKLQCRSLQFEALHTGERLKVDYWVDGAYVPGALASVNRVLRDCRSGEVHAIDPKLLDLLHQIGHRLEIPGGYQVISGYRSPATNAMLHDKTSGVANKSLHMVGKAIDIRVPGRALEKVHSTALSLKVGGVGFYPKSDFVHVDVGRPRSWSM